MKAINLHRLQIFRTVYELAGISAAARKLNLAQPTVSRHLAVFEDELKVSLFSNVAGRIEPTWEAQRLYAETSGLFERVEMLERSVEALQRGSSDSLRIVGANTLCISLIPEAVGTLQQKMPDLSISVDGGGAAAQLMALRGGMADITVGAPVAGSPDLRQDHVGRTALVAVMPKSHPLAGRKMLDLRAFNGFPCVMPNPKAPIGGLVHKAFEAAGAVPSRVLSAMSPSFAIGLVASTGWCSVTDEITAHDFGRGRLAVIPLEKRIEIELVTLELSRSPSRRSAGVFKDALGRAFKAYGQRAAR